MQEVVLYFDPQDADSRALQAFLREHGVGVVELDVRRDPALLEELAQTGSRLVPTVVVNGVAVAGFRPAVLREVLGL
jgi:glutaredoxin